jgi:hypothetical protein
MKYRFVITVTFLVVACNTGYAQLDQQKVRNIESFARAYGYMRYFNPADEAITIDWEKFAFHGVRKIMQAPATKLREQLTDLFIPIAPAVKFYHQNEPFAPLQQKFSKENLLPVYWQHLGDGKGSVGYPYASMRINRPARVLPESQNDYSFITKRLDVEKVKGRQVQLTAFFKAGATMNAYFSVILLVKDVNKEAVAIASTNNDVSTNKWSKYTVTATIPATVERLTAAVQSINMAGTSYIDSVQITVKEGEQWQLLLEENFDTITTEVFQKEWRPRGDNQEIDIASDKSNSFVKIERTKGKLQNNPPLFNETPPQNEILQKSVGNKLQIAIPIVLWADSLHTYPKGDEQKLEALKQELSKISSSELIAKTVYTRIANVIILWNKMQHFYPEMDRLKLNWSNELTKAIIACFSDSTVQQHRITLTKMLIPLKDSHMTLNYTSLMPAQYLPAVIWEWIENKLVVTHVFDESLNIRKGEIVVSVDGVPAEKYWNTIRQQVLGATDSRKNFKAINEGLEGELNSAIEIETEASKRENKKISVTRKFTLAEIGKRVTATMQPAFNRLKDSIYYIDVNRLSWNDLKLKIMELVNAKGLILDLRKYPQWQTIDLVRHFIDKPIEQLTFGKPKVVYPDRKYMEIRYDTASKILPLEPRLKMKVVLLTGGEAVSYAETFTQLFEYYQLAEIVGEPTAGTTGSISICYLLGGLQTPWTGMSVLKQDKKTPYNARSGVVPKHIVRKTITGVKAGNDELVDYALSVLSR